MSGRHTQECQRAANVSLALRLNPGVASKMLAAPFTKA
jgi:hypothetical protein